MKALANADANTVPQLARRESLVRLYPLIVEAGPAGCCCGCSGFLTAGPSVPLTLYCLLVPPLGCGSDFLYGSSHGLCWSFKRTDRDLHCFEDYGRLGTPIQRCRMAVVGDRLSTLPLDGATSD